MKSVDTNRVVRTVRNVRRLGGLLRVSGRLRVGGLLRVVVAMVAIVSLSPVASAQGDPPPPTVDLRQFSTSQGSVALVEISSVVPISGRLELSPQYGDSVIARTNVELPTGGSLAVWMPVPRPANGQTTNVEVILRYGGKSVEGFGSSGSPELSVGVMPSALGSRQQPNTSATISGVWPATFAAISIDDIEQRPWILQGFAVLATTAREVSGASPEGQRTIMKWVNRGGELLVDDDFDVPALDASPQPEPGLSTTVGDGIVRRTDGAARAGRWDEILYPPSYDLNQNFGSFGQGRLSWLSFAAIRLPPVGAMLGGMIPYIILAIPVLHIVLRKKKRPMAIWVVGPGFAALTTILVLVVGLALRQQATNQYGSLSEFGPNGSSVVVLADTKSGKHVSPLPSGWTAYSANSSEGAEMIIGRPTRLSVEVPPGGVRLIEARGAVASMTTAPLTATATDLSGTITISYNNTGTRRLTKVTAWYLNDVSSNQFETCSLGELDPGETGSIPCSDLTDNSYGSTTRTGGANDLITAFRTANNRMVYLTAEFAGIPQGLPLASGKEVFNAMIVRVPITGGAVARAEPIQGDLQINRYDLTAVAFGGYTVSGEIWIDGAYQPVYSEPITPRLAPTGVILGRGDLEFFQQGEGDRSGDAAGATEAAIEAAEQAATDAVKDAAEAAGTVFDDGVTDATIAPDGQIILDVPGSATTAIGID